MFDQITIIATIIIFLIVGFLIKRKNIKNIDEYALNRNQISWFSVGVGISMTFAGGAALLNMSSLAYNYKWCTLIDPIALIIGIIIVFIFTDHYRKNNGITISDLLSGSNGKLSFLIGIITTTTFILILAAQFVALSKLLVPYFPDFNPILLTFISSTLIFSYVFLGGFHSVTKTDTLQFIFIALFLIIPVGYFFFSNEGSNFDASEGQNQFKKMSFDLKILLSFSLLYLPVSQAVNIRVKSAGSKKQVRAGLIIAAFIYTLIIVATSYIGITLAENGIILGDSELAYSRFFKEYYPTIGFIAIIAGLSAIISSMDSFALDAVTSLSQDLIRKLKFMKSLNQKRILAISGLFIFSISISIALFFYEILALVFTALLIYVSTIIPIAIAKKMRVNDTYILYSTTFTILSIILLEVVKFELLPKTIFYPTVGILFVVLAFTIRKKGSV